jgi:hypothetical protein
LVEVNVAIFTPVAVFAPCPVTMARLHPEGRYDRVTRDAEKVIGVAETLSH